MCHGSGHAGYRAALDSTTGDSGDCRRQRKTVLCIEFDLRRIILLSVAFAMAIELNVLAAVGKCVFFTSVY